MTTISDPNEVWHEKKHALFTQVQIKYTVLNYNSIWTKSQELFNWTT